MPAFPPPLLKDPAHSREDVDSAPAPHTKVYGISPHYRDGVVVGWNVQMRRRGNSIHRYFSASKYGGTKGAKASAIACRDEVLSKTPPLSKREFGAILRVTNTSGVPGVFRKVSGQSISWVAMAQGPDGVRVQRSFSERRYGGEEVAKSLAIAARALLLGQMDGWLIHHLNSQAPVGMIEPQLESTVRVPFKEIPHAKPCIKAPIPRVYKMARQRLSVSGIKLETYWRAEYVSLDGSLRTKSFSIARYGETQAREMAVAQRIRWLACSGETISCPANAKVSTSSQIA